MTDTIEGFAARTRKAEQDASDGAKMVIRWRRDMSLYSQQMLRIQTKSGPTVPLGLNNAQRIVHDKLEAQLAEKGYVRAIILKARQEGISTYTAARFYRGTTLWKGRNALVMAHREDASEALYRIYDRYYVNTPEELRHKLKAQARGRQLQFVSDTEIAVMTAGGKEGGRSLTRFYIHASEVAFWPNQLENMTAILQTVPPQQGEVILESTANGVGDEFYNRYKAAEAGESDYLPIFLPWWIHEEYTAQGDPGMLSDEETEWTEVGIEWEGARHKLSLAQIAWRRWKIANDFGGDSRVFRQEYPSTAREAFLVSGNAFFDDESLIRAERNTQTPLRFNVLLGPTKGVKLAPSERGHLRIWEKPTRGGHYVIGADTATGALVKAKDTGLAQGEMGGRDYSSADVLKVGQWWQDPETAEWEMIPCRIQVAQFHGYIVPELFAAGLYGLGLYYSCTPDPKRGGRDPALIGVERNHSSGQTIIRWLKDNGYRRQYVNRRINKRNEAKPTTDIGWLTTGQTRMPMLDELAIALRLPEDDPAYIHINSPDTVREAFTFCWSADETQNPKPQGQENCHDDRIMSLAITLQMERFHRHAAPIPVREETVYADTPTGM